jgi:hypothetical protein
MEIGRDISRLMRSYDIDGLRSLESVLQPGEIRDLEWNRATCANRVRQEIVAVQMRNPTFVRKGAKEAEHDVIHVQISERKSTHPRLRDRTIRFCAVLNMSGSMWEEWAELERNADDTVGVNEH